MKTMATCAFLLSLLATSLLTTIHGQCPPSCTCYQVLPNQPRWKLEASSGLGSMKQTCHPDLVPFPGLYVNCSHAGMTQIPRDIPRETVSLDLSFNGISTVENSSFKDLDQLRCLTLSDNHVKKIEQNAFLGLGQLVILDLSWNYLPLSPHTYLHFVFKPLQSLTTLLLNKNSDTKLSYRNDLHENSDTKHRHKDGLHEEFGTKLSDGGKGLGQSGPGLHLDYPDEALSQLSNLQILHMDGLANRVLGPGFQNLTKLTNLSLEGKTGNCYMVNLTSKVFLHTPYVKHLNISECNIASVTGDAFSPLKDLQVLDLSFNQALGFDLLGVLFEGLAETKLQRLVIDSIVHSRVLGTIINSTHLQHFKKLKYLQVVSARFNKIEAFDDGVLCTSVPPSLEKVYLNANLLQLASYVNDLRCLGALIRLDINGFDNYWTPPLRPPDPAQSSDRKACCVAAYKTERSPVGVSADSDNSMESDLPSSSKQHFAVDTKPSGRVHPELAFEKASSGRRLRGNPLFTESSMIGGTVDTNKMSIEKSVFDKDKHASETEKYLVDTQVDNPPTGKEFQIPPNLSQFHARHFGLFYKLETIRVNSTNKLAIIDMSENHFPVWRGPVEGLTHLTHLYLVDTFTVHVYPEFFDNFPALRILNISGNRLREVFWKDEQGAVLRGLRNLRVLDLSWNDLGHLPNNTLAAQSQLEQLRLAGNGIGHFTLNISHMTRLQHVDLSKNQINSLSKPVRDHLDLVARSYNVTVDLTFNPIACICANIEFLRWIRYSQVYFGSHQNYYCQLEDGSEKKMSDIMATIDELDRSCTSKVGLLIGAVSMCLFVAALLIVAVVYRYRWKLRYLYYTVRLNFQRQRRERGDEFRYDAFVSFVGEDTDFVMGELRQELEENRQLSLCIHERDFVPGQFIASNIVDSVQRSRHTLVVLTRSLLASHWCHYELQMALMEAAETGRDVLLFLLYEHVPSAELPREILFNIQAHSYTDFPHSEMDRAPFWDRLAEALRA